MHLFHIPQCIIQKRNVHISVLNGTLWDMEQVHCGISETDLVLTVLKSSWNQKNHHRTEVIMKH